mmetsp:Transcript_15483/g.33687  ORF Transcript_15483/g.33687 Transcript_15483/m.33687 type:complete len:542 (+) Transcript_15483:55-1680(+)
MTSNPSALPQRPPDGVGDDDGAVLQMGVRAAGSEGTPLLHHASASASVRRAAVDGASDSASVASRTSAADGGALPWILTYLSNRIVPAETEMLDDGYYSYDTDRLQDSVDSVERAVRPHSPVNNSPRRNHHHHKGKRVRRSLSRRIFLLLTEPQTSIASLIFFVILVLAIALSNILMMMQTMPTFQFKPDDCVICGGSNEYYSSNDDALYTGPPLPDLQNLPIACECPPVPLQWTVTMEDVTIWFFTVEWTLRVLCYEPASASSEYHSFRVSLQEKLSYIMEWTTILDALAIFPYYIERYEKTNGLLSLRLLRLFRVFQLLRLGQYNTTFLSLMNVLVESILSFNILLIVLMFGAAFFGSMIFWMEKGEWKYTTYSDPPMFAYMRTASDGVSEEPTPFTSIPASFWWFIVTATTVGYGDVHPTSFGGKCVAGLAMLMGVLVIAFPVSVFSDLWSKELKKAGVLEKLDSGRDSIGNDSIRESTRSSRSSVRMKTIDENISVQQQLQSDDAIMISADDLEAIKSHLRRIDESQLEIRRVLENY